MSSTSTVGTQVFQVDVIVVGAGIQGLWLLADLIDAGYQAILLERISPGSGQTGHSHVFLHQGHMFAGMVRKPQGEIIASIESVWEANGRWKESIDNGRLKGFPLLTNDFYVGWSNSTNANIFEGICSLAKLPFERLEATQTYAFSDVARVYKLGCTCLESKALLDHLLNYKDLKKRISHCEEIILQARQQGQLQLLAKRRKPEDELQIRTNALILAAGAGNEHLVNQIFANGPAKPKQQTIKTYMLVVRNLDSTMPAIGGMFPNSGWLFMVPRKDTDGRTIWLIGNGHRKLVSCAGEMTSLDATTWFQRIKPNLDKLFPRIMSNKKSYEWGIYEGSKAEPWTASQENPEGGDFPKNYSIQKDSQSPIWVTWPSLLTLAPAASNAVMEDLRLAVTGTSLSLNWTLWENFRVELAPSDCRWKTTPMQAWKEFNKCFMPSVMNGKG